jgi:4-amino-4-deoxy-L-arabinose transferase-like glycosyltransferase
MSATSTHLSRPVEPLWLGLLSLAVAISLYLFMLGSAYAPTNGDEMVYLHIARLTAASGQWLPLVSELENMRNTKPPLLFWQAMVAGQWGDAWSLWVLRLPSIVYTFITAACVGGLTWLMRRDVRTAVLSVLLYLVFFSTFRYCRVYVTSAPETFWLALPLFALLYGQLRASATASASVAISPDWLGMAAIGLSWGLGLAYKSFALIVPAALTLWLWLVVQNAPWRWQASARISLQVAWSSMLALAVFGLWFVLDPNPAAVWKEFVMAENAGKMNTPQGYWHAALFGSYPIWQHLLAYPENAGILAFVVMGLGWLGLKTVIQRRWQGQTLYTLPWAQTLLLIWLLVWLLVFALPSQRSARYVIPAMPAVAILLALHWDKIGKIWFYLTLLITLPAILIVGRISWVIGHMDVGSPFILTLSMLAVAASCGLLLLAVLRPHWSKWSALLSCWLLYASFNLMIAPLSAPEADYPPAVQNQLRGKSIAVPNGFNGQFERYQFVLPGALITPYDAEGRNTGTLQPDMPGAERLNYLLQRFDAVVWLQDTQAELQPLCVPNCTLLGQRWHIKSRHRSGEITWDNLWYPQEWLFRREWLVVPLG